MKKFRYILFLFILFTACDKPQNMYSVNGVEGVVRDATTEECIANAKIYLLESDDSGGVWSPPAIYYKDSMVTDVYGNFEFEFEKIIGNGYALFAKKEHYIEGTVLTFVQYGEIKDVLLSPEAFLTVNVKSIGDYDPWDYVSIDQLNIEHLSGSEVDTTVSIVTYGNQIKKIYVFVYDDGINNGSILHEVYCPAFDTTYYELLY